MLPSVYPLILNGNQPVLVPLTVPVIPGTLYQAIQNPFNLSTTNQALTFGSFLRLKLTTYFAQTASYIVQTIITYGSVNPPLTIASTFAVTIQAVGGFPEVIFDSTPYDIPVLDIASFEFIVSGGSSQTIATILQTVTPS